MITNIKANPKDWLKTCYIASKKEITYDEYGNEIVIYDEPVEYKFNYQPLSSSADIATYGEKASMMQKAVIPISYIDKFKEFDVAYLNDATPTGEKTYGEKANYVLNPPEIQNSVIILYFKRLAGK